MIRPWWRRPVSISSQIASSTSRSTASPCSGSMMLASSAVTIETGPYACASSAHRSTASAPRFSTCTVSTSPGGLIDAPRSTDRPMTSSIRSSWPISRSVSAGVTVISIVRCIPPLYFPCGSFVPPGYRAPSLRRSIPRLPILYHRCTHVTPGPGEVRPGGKRRRPAHGWPGTGAGRLAGRAARTPRRPSRDCRGSRSPRSALCTRRTERARCASRRPSRAAAAPAARPAARRPPPAPSCAPVRRWGS